MQTDTVPPLANQGFEVTNIPNEFLSGVGNAKFNGSVLKYKGDTLIAYRRYDKRHGRTTIGISHLNDSFHHTKSFDCELEPKCFKFIQEDCRLFLFKGELFISYTELDLGAWENERKRNVYQCFAKLDFDGEKYFGKETHRPHYGKNYTGVEKNWVYFENNGELWFSYDIANGEYAKVDVKTGGILGSVKGEKLNYPYGYIRGGTSPVLDGDKYVAFFHGSSHTEWLQRRYYMGFYTFSAEYPFKLLSISAKPMLFGSKNDKFCGAGSPMCVFPMGVIDSGDKYHVSCGVNDTYNTIISIQKYKANESLMEFGAFSKMTERYFLCKGKKAIYKTIEGMSNEWKMIGMSGMNGMTCILKTRNPMTIESLLASPNVSEISEAEYVKKESILKKDTTPYFDGNPIFSRNPFKKI